MSDDQFNYDQLMLDAHRELIREVLLKVEQSGLPGEHHFFIIFSTVHKGTRISDRLRMQYPDEMTIVLQHQYSNLKIHNDRFEIQLSFNRIPELLIIPFAAITGFVDPSVPFGLQLSGDATAGLENSIGMLVPGLPQMAQEEQLADAKEHRDEREENYSDMAGPADEFELAAKAEADTVYDAVVDIGETRDTSVPSIFPTKSKAADSATDKAGIKIVPEIEDETDEPNANIVQLDAFRKKSK